MASKKKPVAPTTQALLERNVVVAAKLWVIGHEPATVHSESFDQLVKAVRSLEKAVNLLVFYEAGGCHNPRCAVGAGQVNLSYCRECREIFKVLDTMRAEMEEPA